MKMSPSESNRNSESCYDRTSYQAQGERPPTGGCTVTTIITYTTAIAIICSVAVGLIYVLGTEIMHRNAPAQTQEASPSPANMTRPANISSEELPTAPHRGKRSPGYTIRYIMDHPNCLKWGPVEIPRSPSAPEDSDDPGSETSCFNYTGYRPIKKTHVEGLPGSVRCTYWRQKNALRFDELLRGTEPESPEERDCLRYHQTAAQATAQTARSSRRLSNLTPAPERQSRLRWRGAEPNPYTTAYPSLRRLHIHRATKERPEDGSKRTGVEETYAKISRISSADNENRSTG